MASKVTDITLTAYEEQRTPHPPVEAVVQLPRNALNDQLKCPVCLSVFTDTVATMEVRARGRRNEKEEEKKKRDW